MSEPLLEPSMALSLEEFVALSNPAEEDLQVSLEALQYAPYFRQFGAIRAVQLAAPKLNKLADLQLSKLALIHYLPQERTDLGMMPDDPLLNNYMRLMMTEHITELGDSLGNPRPLPMPVSQLKRDYRRLNPRAREITNLESTMRDEITIVVENYALLNHLYRYPINYFRQYYMWWNVQAALWKNVGRITESYPQRNQYLRVNLPTILPPMNILRRGEGEMTRTLLPNFVEPEALFILEIWKWLGERRENSVLSKASPESLRQMNIMFVDGDRWIMLNLGLLDQWRKAPGAELSEDSDPAKVKGVLDAVPLQKRFLRMLMTLMDNRLSKEEAAQVTAQIDTAAVPTEIPADGPAGEPVQTDIVTARAEPVKLDITNADGSVSKVKLTSSLNLDRLPEQLIEETEANAKRIDEAITRDLEALEHIAARYQETRTAEGTEDAPEAVEPSTEAGSFIKYDPEDRTLTSGVMNIVNQQADAGMISGAEYRRMQALADAYTRLPNPFGEGQLVDMLDIPKDDLVLHPEAVAPNLPTVPDKSMLSSVVASYDRQYLRNVLPKDIVRSVLSVQNAGVAVTGFQMEEYRDALSNYQQFSVNLTPVVGKPSTVHFKLPVVDDDGTYTDNGTRLRLRKQRGDMPIRKVAPNRVALTSYYNKVFINRSEKKAYTYSDWLLNQVAARAADEENPTIVSAMMADVCDHTILLPRLYMIFASRFRSFTVFHEERPLNFFFDYHARKAMFGEDAVSAAESNGLVVCGRVGDNLLVIDNTGAVYESQGLETRTLGPLTTLLDITGKAPTEMAEIKVLGKLIPLGVVLAYYLGLNELLRLLGVTARRIPTGTRAYLADDEIALRFEDEMLAIPADNGVRSMLLTGLAAFEKSTRNYPVALFNRREIYFNVLEQSGYGGRYLRELDLLRDMFVDPITAELLEEMKEPTEWIGLLLRSCQLLETEWAPDETDMAYMRIKGYERFAGAIYGELVKAIRVQRSRGSVARAKIDMHPHAVWTSLREDPAVKMVEESNPVHNLREREEVTFSGTGGRSNRSMVGRARVFHENDIGLISESTKDSGDVAITTFMTANPTLINVRGTSRRFDESKDGAASIMSSPAILSPCADNDDGKRVNFIPIQHSSGTFCKGAKPTPLHTGADMVMAHRTDRAFSVPAIKDGVVTSLNERGMVVTYEDGTTENIALGRRYGKAQGLYFPQNLTTQLELNQPVKVGDIIAYNDRYFQPDRMVKNQVVWKAGLLVLTALMETPDTLEDSSVISAEVAKELETEITYIRDITVQFKQAVHGLVEPGQVVDINSILCTIEDAVTAENQLFDEPSLDMLRLLSSNTPRAKYKGVVEKVEVLYHGDMDDMSDTLQEITALSDRERKRAARALQQPAVLGRVNESARIQGKPLPVDSLVIRVYITSPTAAGVGDKGVFANQMKTIFGRVMNGRNETADGRPLGAIFSYQSLSNRIVLSPEKIGLTNSLLIEISKRAAKAYRGNR